MYSPIKKIKVVNFRSLGNIEVDFTDCPIISLRGTNESGKSSFVKAIGVVTGNLWRHKQNQYIQTGKDGFAILSELEDSTTVVRKKTSSTNGYTLSLPDGTRRDATKIDVEIPDYIEAVMGIYRDVETKECLQVRTYEDPLLFVSTTDGQNYKTMHNGISNTDVREATVAAKADAARLKADAEKSRSEVDIYNKQLMEIPTLDTEYLSVVLSALERASSVSEVFDTAMTTLNMCKSLDGASVVEKLDACKTVDTNVLRLFAEGVRHLTFARLNTTDCTNVNTVDTAVLNLFERGRNLCESTKKYAAQEVPATVNLVPTEVIPLFEQALRVKQTISEATERYNTLMVGIDKVTAVLQSSGMRVVNCDKCGNDIVVSVGA